jgi:hypothetical protein
MTSCLLFARPRRLKKLEINTHLLCHLRLVSFCVLASHCLPRALVTVFVGVIWSPPLENMGEDLEICLEHVSFLYLHVFPIIVLTLIDHPLL